MAPERAPDRLLAQQLSPERPNAEHVGDGVRVPSLGEHRDRDHATDRVAERARLPDGVHHFTKQVLVGDVVSVTAVAGARDALLPEALNLVGGDLAEVPVQRVAGLELNAIDQQGTRASEPVAVVVEIAKKGQSSILNCLTPVLGRPLEA